jgi:dihydroflavonol-4-reductase
VRVALTGATGFLGSALLDRLLDRGHSVTALVRGEAEALSERGVRVVPGDLLDPIAVRALVADAEAVIHLAGRVSRDPADGPALYRVHVAGTKVLLEAAAEAGVGRFVLASSSGTVGVSKTSRITTELDEAPLSLVARWPYYLSKIYKEKLALSFALEHRLPLVCLNPSLLLGPGDRHFSSSGDIWKFLRRDIPAMPSGGISFVDVRDAAVTFEAALTRGRPGERYLLGASNMTFAEFFGRLSRLSGVDPPRLRLPSELNLLGARALERWSRMRGVDPPIDRASVEMGEHWFFIDSSKARLELGFSPRDPQETLRDTLRDLQQHGRERGSAGASWPVAAAPI